MREQLGESLSLPYLSQIERGARPHLTMHSRELLARFFSVLPGYLVDDPEGYEERLGSLLERPTANLAEWLALRAQELRDDPELYEGLLKLASAPDPRALLVAIGHSFGGEVPGPALVERSNQGVSIQEETGREVTIQEVTGN